MKRYLLVSTILACLVIACGTPEPDPEENCVVNWIGEFYQPIQTSVNVNYETDEMTIQVYQGTEDTILEIYQDIIGTSDFFEVRLYFTAFDPPESGKGFVSLMLYDPVVEDTILDTTQVSCVLTANKVYAVTRSIDSISDNVVPTEGELRIEKTLGKVTAKVIIGTDTTTSTDNGYAANPKRLAIRFGAKSPLGGTMGIKLSSFVVVGNTNLKPDEFTCTSILNAP